MIDGLLFLLVGIEVEEGGFRGSIRGLYYLFLCEYFLVVLKVIGFRYYD